MHARRSPSQILLIVCATAMLSGVGCWCSSLNGLAPTPTSSPTPTSPPSPTPTPTPTPTPSPTLTPTPTPSPTPTPTSTPRPAPPSTAAGLLFTRVDETGAHLLVLPSLEAEANRLTRGESINYSGRWSPDHERIAFLRLHDMGEEADLCVMNADGEDVQVLTAVNADTRNLRWSPDGSRLTFWNWDEEGDTEVWVIDIATAGLRNVTDNEVIWDAYPYWHPDGEHLFIVSDRTPEGTGKLSDQIYLIDLEGNVEAHISHELESLAENSNPTLSPDGQQIAWVAWSFIGDGGIGLTGSNLLLAGPDGSDVRLVAEDVNVGGYAWSPDGTHIAFVATDAGMGLAGLSGRIHVLDVESGEHWQVSDPEAPPLARDVAWRPDGQGLCYVQRRDEEAMLGWLVCVDIDGTNTTVISDIPFDGEPDWAH